MKRTLLWTILLLFCATPAFAKIYSFQAGDDHYIYTDKRLTNVTLRHNGYVVWRNGTIETDQYIHIGVFFSDRISLDANEWSGWWYRAPSVDSDAGYNWTIRSLENSRGRLRELKAHRKRHPDFPLE
ncbi:MAG: hypothetical protein Q4D98_04255 [Planctomycetia bacterium]|nr:hypothetical protein [Planctomycetia bacterium]